MIIASWGEVETCFVSGLLSEVGPGGGGIWSELGDTRLGADLLSLVFSSSAKAVFHGRGSCFFERRI